MMAAFPIRLFAVGNANKEPSTLNVINSNSDANAVVPFDLSLWAVREQHIAYGPRVTVGPGACKLHFGINIWRSRYCRAQCPHHFRFNLKSWRNPEILDGDISAEVGLGFHLPVGIDVKCERLSECNFIAPHPRTVFGIPAHLCLFVAGAHFTQLIGSDRGVNRCGDKGSKGAQAGKPRRPLYRLLCGVTLWVVGAYFGYEVFVRGRADDCIVLGVCLVLGGFGCIVGGTFLVLQGLLYRPQVVKDYPCDVSDITFNGQSGINVSQQVLTFYNYCNTVIVMANVLNTDKQIAAIRALAEGSSIRSIERITGIHRDTIMRLRVRVGKGCAQIMDAKMRDLPCQFLQFEEIWGFIGKKEKHVSIDDDPQECGDVWTFCAVDAETKLVPAFKVGKRDRATANAFCRDVASRMANRVQTSTDALRA
jgi:hypothetical protein